MSSLGHLAFFLPDTRHIARVRATVAIEIDGDRRRPTAYDPMQSEKALQIKGNWAKWSRYEIINGVIVPAEDAALTEYDPWRAYHSNADIYRTVEQPYLSLLELGRQLKKFEEKGVVPSKLESERLAASPRRGPQNRADELILEWCNVHGLLGLLPVLSTEIRVSNQIYHFRHGGRWLTDLTEEEVSGSITTTHRRQESGEHDSVTPMVLADDHRASMTWLSWWVHEYEWTPLADMRIFFGAWSPKEAFTPWRPGTQEFWLKYGEPVNQFGDWCIVFSNSADKLSLWKSGAADLDFVKVGYLVLSRLAESGAPRFELYPTRSVVLYEERVPAGLLASYALMFLWDVVEGRRALRCRNCGRYFVSDESRAAYCSTRCRNTAQSRRYRAKRQIR